MLEHGGNLHAMARQYGIPPGDWLDLSTGINPQGWLHDNAPSIPVAEWARLPQTDDGLVAAACNYYAAEHILPVAGSQAALQMLPTLRPPCRVAVVQPGYAEHAHAWRQAGHRVQAISAWPENPSPDLNAIDVLVLANPNNPTGHRFTTEHLLDWHATLAARGSWLVIDEAFIDATPQDSLARHATQPGLIVLRSLGKYFGLAGARVGFVSATPDLLQSLEERLGPWPVAGPSRWLARQALQDHDWQARTTPALVAASARLAQLLTRHDLPPAGGCALFQWVRTPHAAELHHQLAQHAILIRHFTNPTSLRFGLPATERDWQRLDDALEHLQ